MQSSPRYRTSRRPSPGHAVVAPPRPCRRPAGARGCGRCRGTWCGRLRRRRSRGATPPSLSTGARAPFSLAGAWPAAAFLRSLSGVPVAAGRARRWVPRPLGRARCGNALPGPRPSMSRRARPPRRRRRRVNCRCSVTARGCFAGPFAATARCLSSSSSTDPSAVARASSRSMMRLAPAGALPPPWLPTRSGYCSRSRVLRLGCAVSRPSVAKSNT
jgi:hypothetical protein